MQLRLTATLCAAAFAVANPAWSAIDTGATGNGELFLSVWSQAAGKSYTRDLNVRMDDFLPGSAVTQPVYHKEWQADAGWVAFVTGLTPSQVSALKWDVIALDTLSRQRYLTTASTDVPDLRNFTITQFNAVRTHVEAVNLLGQTQNPGVTQYAANNFSAANSLVASISDGNAYYGSSFKGEQWAGKAVGPSFFTSAALVGDDMDVWLVQETASGPLNFGTVTNFDVENVSQSFFRFEQNGVLSFNTVPIPGTLVLVLAGIAGLGISRRLSSC
jgi:hypothetical protein